MADPFDAGLSADEQKYFESAGTTEIAREAPAKAPDPAPAEPAQEADSTARETASEPDTHDDGGTEERTAQTVPYGRLKAETERRKQVEAAARETELKLARLEAQFEMLRGGRQEQPQQVEEPGIPDPDEDVFGATRGALKEIENLKQHLQQQERHQQNIQQVQSIVSTYRQQAEAYKAKAPDFMDAYEHLTKSRATELEAMGISDPRQVQQIMEADELRLAHSAIQNGRSAAEALYTMAKARGYAPKAAAPPVEQEAKTEEARSRSKTLSGVGGSPTGPMTRERLGNMAPKDFDAYYDKNPDKVLDILGRQ